MLYPLSYGRPVAPAGATREQTTGALRPARNPREPARTRGRAGCSAGGALIEGPAGVSGSLLLAVAGAALAVLVTLVPGRRPVAERVRESVAA